MVMRGTSLHSPSLLFRSSSRPSSAAGFRKGFRTDGGPSWGVTSYLCSKRIDTLEWVRHSSRTRSFFLACVESLRAAFLPNRRVLDRLSASTVDGVARVYP